MDGPRGHMPSFKIKGKIEKNKGIVEADTWMPCADKDKKGREGKAARVVVVLWTGSGI